MFSTFSADVRVSEILRATGLVISDDKNDGRRGFVEDDVEAGKPDEELEAVAERGDRGVKGCKSERPALLLNRRTNADPSGVLARGDKELPLLPDEARRETRLVLLGVDFVKDNDDKSNCRLETEAVSERTLLDFELVDGRRETGEEFVGDAMEAGVEGPT